VGTLLGETLPLALAAAISPVLFLLQLNTLTGPRPVARGSMLALGAALPLAVVSACAVMVGSSSSSLHSDSTIKASLDLAFGCLLLGLAIWTLVRHPVARPPRPAKEPSLRRAFLFGVVGMATNVSTFALYIPALKLIAAAGIGAASQALVGAIVFALALSFVLVPLALTVAVPGSQQVLSRVGAWMTAHRRALNAVLLIGFGAWLVLKGVRAF
jgi:threonine/homoserine/homoserine lactone efflux protein